MARWSLEKFKKIQNRARALWHDQLFHETEEGISNVDRFAHFWLLVGRGFLDNRCLSQAAGLAYTTILALIPVLAVAVSVSTAIIQEKGREPIDRFIEYMVDVVAPMLNLEAVDDEEEATIGRAEVVNYIHSYVDNVRSGALGITAVIFLLFIAIALLSSIETAFNDMWGVSQGRSWMKRVVQYWAALTLGPLLLFIALGMTTGREFQSTREWVEQVPVLGRMVFFILPFILLSLFLSLFYLLMPNTRVNLKAALIGGTIAGCTLQLNNLFYVIYVSRVVMYHTIYGSLSAVPLFLMGLYFSWIIVLFGGQIAFVFQNRKAYLQQKRAENVNQRGREFIALRLMTWIALRFSHGETPPTRAELADFFAVPIGLVSQIIATLRQANLLVEVVADDDYAYTPARPLSHITEQDILQALRTGRGMELPTCEDPTRSLVLEEFQAIEEAEKKVAANVSFAALVGRIESETLNEKKR